jgi:hypothetical protein
VASRAGEEKRNYRDLRERTKRKELRREENLKRIVELYRARSLHSSPGQTAAGGTGVIDIAA